MKRAKGIFFREKRITMSGSVLSWENQIKIQNLLKFALLGILILLMEQSLLAQTQIPSGTPVSIQIDRAVNSNSVQVGSQFSGRVDMDVIVDNKIVISEGTKVMGTVVSAVKAGRVAGKAEIGFVLSKIQQGDRYVDAPSSVLTVSASEGQGRKTARNVAVGAGVGAVYNKGKGAGRGAATMGAVSLLGGDGSITVPKGYSLQFQLQNNVEY